MYHEIIGDEEGIPSLLEAMEDSYFIKKSVFEEQINFLQKNGFKIISLFDTINHFKDPYRFNISDRSIVITFDDGREGNYKYAFPVLDKFKLTATFFCTVEYIGKENMMSWEQLRIMKNAGMSIQSHCLTHPFLKQLSNDDVKKELSCSKRILEEQLQSPIDFISLPHGSWGKNYKRIAQESGFIAGCSSVVGLNNGSVDRFLLRRIHVSGKYSLEKFKVIVSNEKNAILFIKLDKTIKSLIRLILGEKLYFKIYNLIFNIK
jgi:peptidoglycan/xylan/chitin deacetylase (PgdA/CDA1 family)